MVTKVNKTCCRIAMLGRIFARTKPFSLCPLICIVTLVGTNCKTFTICELIMELQQQGFPDSEIKDWVCLIEAESSRRSDAIGGPDEDGSYDYGLFQINSRYWCDTDEVSTSPGEPRKGCDLRCKDLLLDNITLASKCAMKIKKIQGLEAWLGWVNQCKGKKINIVDCKLTQTLL